MHVGIKTLAMFQQNHLVVLQITDNLDVSVLLVKRDFFRAP